MKDPNKQREGYKLTKVGWIPTEWSMKRPKELGCYVTSGSRGWADFYSDQGDPFIRITNLTRHSPYPDLTNLKRVQLPEESSEGKRTNLQENDLLVSITADLGIIGYIDSSFPIPSYISQHLALLRFNKSTEVHPKYASYFLSGEQLRNHFLKITDQGAKAGLNLEAIRSLPLALPPLSEQEQIATILSTWDNGLQQLEALIKAKTLQKCALMQRLLTSESRLSGFAGDWNTVQLSSILRHLFRPVEWHEDTLFDLVSIRRRAGGLFRRGLTKGADYKTKDLHRIEAGDLLISKRQVTHGALSVVTEKFEGGIVSKEYSIFENIVPEKLHMPFLDWLTKEKRFWWICFVASNGVDIEKLIFSPTDFLKATISLPPTIEEQAEIAKILTTAETEITLLKAKQTALQQQKKSLMQKLLTGQVRVTI